MNATLEPPAAETPETFDSLADATAPPDVSPAPALHTFQGKPLHPLDPGTHLLVKEALTGIRGDELLSLVALLVLIDLQTGVSLYGQDGWDPDGQARALDADTAATMAMADVLGAVENVKVLQARAIQWRKSLGKKAAREGVALVGTLFAQYRADNPEE